MDKVTRDRIEKLRDQVRSGAGDPDKSIILLLALADYLLFNPIPNTPASTETLSAGSIPCDDGVDYMVAQNDHATLRSGDVIRVVGLPNGQANLLVRISDYTLHSMTTTAGRYVEVTRK